MKVYKTISDGHSGITRGALCLEYQVGFTTYPEVENSPLFAFDNLEDALEFKSNLSMLARNEVLLCEAGEWKERDLLFIPNAIWADVEDLIQWWDENVACLDEPWPLPKGTVLCKWIKPIEIVE